VIYDVRQTTAHTYASKVGFARHVLHLTPIDRPRQRVHAAALDIVPKPAAWSEGQDFFGNRTTWIVLDEPHDRLVVNVAARVVVDAVGEPTPGGTPNWESVIDEVFATRDLGPTSPIHFVFPSRRVSLAAEIRNYAAESFPPGCPVLDGAISLMRRIKGDFTYQIGATTVSTTPERAFALRRGVCQDFAHVMIAGMRGLGLPAAYVSGYLRTIGRSAPTRLAGADAMHAWVQVWCGFDAGWYGLDPTNATLAGEDHVVLALGRDYADVAPIDGVVFAAGAQQLAVTVSVTPLG
jgi:transglutaminase-like putative cysteine protease